MKTLLVLVLALGLAAPALASDRHPTLGELEGEVMCPTCKTTLDQSSAPIADRIRQYISARIAAGDTKSEIEDRLVANYGNSILAAPPRHGFGLVAWWLPIVGITAAAVVVGAGAWRWSRTREPAAPAAPLDPALERRVDDELRRYEA